MAQEDLEVALSSEAELVHSAAFGAMAIYPVADFRAMVNERISSLSGADAEAIENVKKLDLSLINLKDEIETLDQTLAIDSGDLMHRVVSRNNKLRLVAFNVSNYFSNDVTGE